MFVYHRTIRMRDTDATGVIYFANQLVIGLEAFEAYLSSKRYGLAKMIKKEDCLFPIVHTEANFLSPIGLDERLEIRWQVRRISNRSFAHTSAFFFEEKEKRNCRHCTCLCQARGVARDNSSPNAG